MTEITLNDAESIQHLGELLPKEAVADIAMSGLNEEACFFWARELNLKLTRKTLINWLKEEGGWTDQELKSKSILELKVIAIWLASWLAFEQS